MGVELRTDTRHRYTLYRSDDTGLMPFATREDKQKAIDAGKKYSVSAYPDVWAKDAALVTRVRQFLADNFHWHDRLAKTGADLEVVQMLLDMVRGGSVVVVPEEPRYSGGLTWPPKKPESSSFWGVANYDETPFVSVKERYQAQLERIAADAPTWAETQAMMDGINTTFMHGAILADPLGTLPTFAQAGWISKYGLPDMTGVDEIPDMLTKSLAGERSTLLGDAQPFELGDNPLTADSSFDLAATPNTGAPGWYTNLGSGQMRLFGSNGNPVVDFDFDHDHGQGIPHAHNWDSVPGAKYPVRGPGVSFSPF